jgi:shikimate kinase
VALNRIYLVGFMGAGKTTIGRRLAQKLGWKFVDLDEEIERREHRSVADIFKQDGEPRFREIERFCLQELSTSPRTVIALGGGAFVAEENRALAEKTGLTVWLKVSFAKVTDRVKIDGTRPNFADPQKAERLFHSRQPCYALARVHVETDGAAPESVADEIIGVVRKS